MKTRGIVQLVVLVYVAGALLVSGIVYEAAKIFSPGRNTKTADKIAALTAQVQDQAKVIDQKSQENKGAIKAANAAHAEVVKTHVEMESSATGYLAASTTALKSDATPTAAETVALGLNDAASRALGSTLTPAQAELWSRLVAGLLAKNAAAQAEVARLEADSDAKAVTITAVTARATAAEAHETQIAGELTTETHAHVAAACIAAKLGAENKSWADDAQTIGQRIKALGWLSVFLGILIFGLGVKFLGLKTTLGDAVALTEFVKGEAIKAGHDAASLEHKVKDWWNSSKNEKVIANIKDKVLRQ